MSRLEVVIDNYHIKECPYNTEGPEGSSLWAGAGLRPNICWHQNKIMWFLYKLYSSSTFQVVI